MASTPSIPEIDVLIHEPARLRVLALLSRVDQADFMFLLRQTGLTRGNLSVQMSRLEQAGIVALDRRLEGNRSRTAYFLTAEGWEALKDYRRAMAQLVAGFPESRRRTDQ
ncbi:MAG: transcriptional regulator [Lysobacterales bacterium]|jgi:DNA-binding transcriptional ArsR family regulator